MWWILGLLWLAAEEKKKKTGPATGPAVETKSGPGHFSGPAKAPASRPSTGPATETKSGRGHF